jgi:hypothetical protein
MVLVLIVGGWLGWAVRSARRQREAVAAIRRTGGGITYRSQYLGGNVYGHVYDHGAKPRWCPRWLADQVGIDYFDSVVQVVFVNDTSHVTDDILPSIANLDGLEWLALDAQGIANAGLEKLR